MATRSKQQPYQQFPPHPKFGPSLVVPVPLSLDLPSNTGNFPKDVLIPMPGVISETKAELSSTSPDPLSSPACPSDEDRAEAIVGERFYDDDFGWCTVTGFGTDRGRPSYQFLDS